MADVKNRAKSDRKVQVIGLWSECCHTGTRPVGLSHSVKKVPLGGLDNLLRQLVGMVALPLLHGEIFRQFGICPPRGVLIYGPAGCGKTLLANSIAAELGVALISVQSPSLISGVTGDSEKSLRDLFEAAKRKAPCILFLDEIDAIITRRDTSQREMERRLIAQLSICLDDLNNYGRAVVVLAATSRPDNIDPALRRAGRFDKEVSLTVPTELQRDEILRKMLESVTMKQDVDIPRLAKETSGYVGADLKLLVSTAATHAIKRNFAFETSEPNSIDKVPFSFREENTAVCLSNSDFSKALREVQPSGKREGFTSVPTVSWADIGALSAVRSELQLSILLPMKYPQLFTSVGVTAPAGILLWGPPGCGKTLLAKALAKECNANFISVKGPELLNKYLGESERSVRQLFSRARLSAPCLIFFDELDALAPRRDKELSEGASRVVNTLLTELDGLESRGGIFVLGATNRPDVIDPALLRPGRFDKRILVDLPNPAERVEILKKITKTIRIAADVILQEIGLSDDLEGFSGADLASLCREAGISALHRTVFGQGFQFDPEQIATSTVVVTASDFKKAMRTIKPSVAKEDRGRYLRLQKDYNAINTKW